MVDSAQMILTGESRDMVEFVLPAVIGLIAGAIGSLVAPWVQWAVEKRRGRSAHRLKMIEACRKAITKEDTVDDPVPFGSTAEYSWLRPHLDPKFREGFERGRTMFVGSSGRHPDGARSELLDALTELEKKWDLV